MNAVKILIVEDEAIVAMQLEKIFTRLGYQVYPSAMSGEQAVQIVRDKPPDVVIMDRRLADKMDGLEATRQIRAFSQIPIIFMTGYVDQSMAEQILKLQPAVYLVKPVEIPAIQAAIDSLLDKTKQHKKRKK